MTSMIPRSQKPFYGFDEELWAIFDAYKPYTKVLKEDACTLVLAYDTIPGEDNLFVSFVTHSTHIELFIDGIDGRSPLMAHVGARSLQYFDPDKKLFEFIRFPPLIKGHIRTMLEKSWERHRSAMSYVHNCLLVLAE